MFQFLWDQMSAIFLFWKCFSAGVLWMVLKSESETTLNKAYCFMLAMRKTLKNITYNYFFNSIVH